MIPEYTETQESTRKMSARARKCLQALLQALESKGQDNVAAEVGLHESTISRLKSQFDPLCAVIDTVGLKIVPQTLRCYEPKQIESLLFLARQRMADLDSVEKLEWE